MKKTLIAVAALSAMAASAMAANVTLYGALDQSVVYQNKKVSGQKATNAVWLAAGYNGGEKWGITGTEEVGAVKVGFVLESGFYSDEGKWGGSTGSKLFNRQAELNVSGAFGKFAFGRMGTINDGTNGGFMHGMMAGFGTSYKYTGSVDEIMCDPLASTRIDNAVRYDSPKFAGFQLIAQYSDAVNTDDSEADRDGDVTYAAAAIRYANGPFNAAVSFDETKTIGDAGHQYGTQLAANYDFGVLKVYAGAGFYKNFAGAGLDKKAMIVGVDVPVCGGTLMMDAGVRKTESATETFDKYGVGVGYKYSFSKRTSLRTTIGYLKDESATGSTTYKTVTLGLNHSF